MQKNKLLLKKLLLIAFAEVLILSAFSSAAPGGPTILSNSTETAVPAPATLINTSGGTISTINLFGFTQNPHWKAYVGNVSGKYTLQDGSNYTIYDWTLSTVAGEVYASRNSSVNWSAIGCADNSSIASEESALNVTSSSDDSISRTFAAKAHRRFYVGTMEITNSSCYSTATFVNNQSQAQDEGANFQEVLLSDTKSMVYSTLLENRSAGYNTQRFDFQMIVSDYGMSAAGNVLYYFYLELV